VLTPISTSHLEYERASTSRPQWFLELPYLIGVFDSSIFEYIRVYSKATYKLKPNHDCYRNIYSRLEGMEVGGEVGDNILYTPDYILVIPVILRPSLAAARLSSRGLSPRPPGAHYRTLRRAR
jgi:hypothetical protein